MQDSVIAALVDEETRLQAELQANTTFRRLEAVRSALRTLREAYASTMISRPGYRSARLTLNGSVTPGA